MAKSFSERESEVAELMKQADTGDADAQYKFARYLLFEDDEDLRKDLSPDEVKRAMDYLQLAAIQGYRFGWAAAILGDLYYAGELIPQDFEKARLWYNTALLKENPGASYKLGEYSYYGIDCPVDYEEAVKYYMQSLDGCYIDAFVRLGAMFMRGEYFSQDIEFAKILFEFVRDYEKDRIDWFGVKSALYEMALSAIVELEQGVVKQSGADKAVGVQKAVRERLLEVMDEVKV